MRVVCFQVDVCGKGRSLVQKSSDCVSMNVIRCYSNSLQLQRKKVKVCSILVQTLRFFTGRTAHMGSRGIALLFLDHGTRRG